MQHPRALFLPFRPLGVIVRRPGRITRTSRAGRFLAACALLLVAPTAAIAGPATGSMPPTMTTDTPGGHEELAAPTGEAAVRAAGRLGLHLAAASVNGLRLGLRYVLHPQGTLEADAGYVRITLIEETGTTYTDGWSVSGGGNWHLLPEADVSPLLALFVSVTTSAPLPQGDRQRRLAVIPCLGSEYFITHSFSLFFRFGPAFQLTDDRGGSRFETTAQFDAGLAYVF